MDNHFCVYIIVQSVDERALDDRYQVLLGWSFISVCTLQYNQSMKELKMTGIRYC